MTLEDKIRRYKEIGQTIENLEAQKKSLVQEILALLPPDAPSLDVAEYRVRRAGKFIIKTSLETARTFDCVRLEETVDKTKIKRLIEQGQYIPDVTQIHFIQVTAIKK